MSNCLYESYMLECLYVIFLLSIPDEVCWNQIRNESGASTLRLMVMIMQMSNLIVYDFLFTWETSNVILVN